MNVTDHLPPKSLFPPTFVKPHSGRHSGGIESAGDRITAGIFIDPIPKFVIIPIDNWSEGIACATNFKPIWRKPSFGRLVLGFGSR
jgi:hypothetical protein